MESVNSYLFVYGTLRRGLSSPVSHLIENDITWIGHAVINAELYDIGEYPGAVPSKEAKSVVKGEIIEISKPEKVLKILDRYEGCDQENGSGTEYTRKKERIKLPDGEIVEAWVYWYNLPVKDKRRITDNDYLKYLRKKQLA